MSTGGSRPATRSPTIFPEQYVCSTPFPPDDRSLGWERGTSVSKGPVPPLEQSEIDAATVVVPLTVAPPAGDVIDVDGGVVSGVPPA